MRYYLSGHCCLKLLETPAVYDLRSDELYELDDAAFAFLRACASDKGGEGGAAETEFLDYCITEGIVAARPAAGRREPPLEQSPIPSLRYLELQITDRCNLRCRHCYIDRSRDRELSVEMIERVLSEFERLQGLRLLITGGEPLLHRRFGEVNALLPRYAFRKILFTNGLLLDKGLLAGLAVDEVQLSIDGMERGHDALRGKGSYKKVMGALETTLSAGMAASVSTMVHRGNLDEFGEMEALFEKLGVRDWTVDVPCAVGALKDNPLLQVTPGEGGRYLAYGFGGGLHGGGEGYGCGLHLAAVLADGNVAKCAFYAEVALGSVAEGLRTCWARLKPVRLEELECAALSCTALDQCRGGCRYRAAAAAGGAGKRDPYKCRAYDIM